MSEEKPKKHKMDLTNVTQGIWLVKMPRYVARLWDKSPSDMQVATLRMEHSADEKAPPKVKLVLSQQLLQLDPEKLCATEHELKLSKATSNTQTTGIFSTTDSDSESAMEGVIKYKMECLPVCNAQYLRMKQQACRNARCSHSAEAIGHIVSNFKPVSNHLHNVRCTTYYIILYKGYIMFLLSMAARGRQAQEGGRLDGRQS